VESAQLLADYREHLLHDLLGVEARPTEPRSPTPDLIAVRSIDARDGQAVVGR
jgi:hypothetical protein